MRRLQSNNHPPQHKRSETAGTSAMKMIGLVDRPRVEAPLPSGPWLAIQRIGLVFGILSRGELSVSMLQAISNGLCCAHTKTHIHASMESTNLLESSWTTTTWWT